MKDMLELIKLLDIVFFFDKRFVVIKNEELNILEFLNLYFGFLLLLVKVVLGKDFEKLIKFVNDYD